MYDILLKIINNDALLKSVLKVSAARVAISDRQNRVNRGIFVLDWNSAGRAREIWSANSG